MLRGLVIKQSFLLADLLLMVAIGVVIVMAALQFIRGGAVSDNRGRANIVAEPEVDLAMLRDRQAYAKIIENRLFGVAGEQSTDVAQEPEPVQETIEPTTLPYQLKGTTSAGPTNPLSSAMIDNRRAQPRIQTYFVNEEIQPNVRLVEVHKRYVILQMGNQKQYLALDTDEDLVIAPASQQAQNTPRTQQANEAITLSRAELTQEILQASDQLANLNPRNAYDDQGNVIGVTADNVAEVPLAGKLGFEEGDVVQQINGEEIDGLDKVAELLQRLQNESNFSVRVLRNNRPQTLNFRIQ